MKTRIKRTTVLLICLCMVFSLLPEQAIAADLQSATTLATTQDWTGYTAISSKEELDSVRDNRSGNYYLTADIIFTEEDFAEGGEFYNDGKGWIPIATFAGILDGNGYEISGLYINSDGYQVGLFSQITGTIKNLGIVNSQIIGGSPVGAFAGFAERGSSIINCHNTSTVIAKSQNDSALAGGIVGDAGKATIKTCYNTGDIYAESVSLTAAAGVVGWGYACTISECYNTGYINSVAKNGDNTAYAAGIACLGNKVLDCYNTGRVFCINEDDANIYSTAKAGGITSFTTTFVTNCYNVGQVDARANNTSIGGAVVSANNVSGCYYLDNVSDNTSAIKCSASQMEIASTFVEYDFDSVWTMDGNSEYPYPELVNNSMIAVLDSVEISHLPNKLTYLENMDTLDVSGGKLTLYYNNNQSKEVDITIDMLSGFDNTVIGIQTLTVTYSGKSCTYDVEVIAKNLDSIAVTTQPTKLSYLEGKETLDTAGGKITLYYNNGSIEEIDITDDMISGFDNTITGTQTLTVTYNDKPCTYDVEIVAKQLVSIAITKQPNKCCYLLGEETLDVTDGRITLYYNNDTFEEVDMAADMVTGFDNTLLGSQTLTVEYEGFTDVYQVQIISEDAPQIVVNGGVATNGGIVVVSIALKNNPGIASMRLKVDYDSSAMSLIGVSDLGKIGSEIHSDQYTDPYVLCWANDTVTENFTVNGDIVTLTFKISNTAALGSYDISVSYDYDKYDIHNVQVEKVKFYTVAGSVEVVDVLIGDVNGDGSLDTLDRLTLSRYLANWQGYTIDDINIIGADVNSDGSVDTLDRLILSRHLANWSGYEDITNPPT